ncbi:hypothetical protein [Amycolatopsis sp. lyj-23]|uniref:hypothetical protein n=1 Tax=Amycolatopsis sp. lyj-23 TaxID=2789283 RepID=UPI00397A3BEE
MEAQIPELKRLSAEAADVARAVVARCHEGEAEAFDDLLDAYEADPSGTVHGGRLNAPVGIGVELAAITPWVLAAAGAAGGVLVEKVAEDAYAAGRRWLSQAWTRRRTGKPVDSEPEGASQATILITVHLHGCGAPEELAHEVAAQVVEELDSGRGDAR